jgi:drug/metabolite transporter (DMT)-like permease
VEVQAPRSFGLNLPLIVTVLSWGFNFVALKLLYVEMSPPAVAFVRFGLMYGMLVVVCVWRRESLRFARTDSFRILLLGFVSMGVYMILFLEGMRGSAPAEGAIILATSPIFTTILAVLAGQERFSPLALVGALVAFAGVVIVIVAGQEQTGDPGRLLGNLLILVSSVVWAFSVVMMRPLLGRYSPTQLLTMSMPGALVALIPYGLVATLAVDWGGFSPTIWLLLVHVSLLSGVIAFIGFYAGVRQIGGAGAMMYQFFVPPCAAFFGWLAMGKTLVPLQGVGLVVVIVGVVFASWNRLLAARAAE